MSQLKVLVVEDDLHTRNIIEMVLKRDRMLRYHQLEVLTASDGAEGLALFRQHAPVLVITDLLMPKLDGFQLIEALRREGGEGLVIVATSAIVRDPGVLRKLERDFRVHVQLKPFSPRVLADQVRRLLADLGPATPERGAAETELPPPAAGAAVAEAATSATSAGRAPRVATPPRVAVAAIERAEGDLAQDAPAALLLRAFEEQWSGTLDLARDKLQKRIFVLNGFPIFVQSNLREEALGELLLRRGGLTEEQHRGALRLAQQQRLRYGEALVRARIMSETDVLSELVQQTAFKLERCLRWHAGHWVYQVDAEVAGKVPRCTVDPVRVVFEGLRGSIDVEDAAARLQRWRGSLRFLSQPRFERYREAFAAAVGDRVLGPAARGCTVEELRALPDRSTVAVQVEVLLQTGMVLPEGGSAALGGRDAVIGRPGSSPRRAGAGRAVRSGDLAADPSPGQATAQKLPSFDLLALDTLAAPLRQAPALAPFPTGAAMVGAGASPSAAASGSHAAPREEGSDALRLARQLIESTYLGLHRKNHYEVLGVIGDTDAAGIEVAYRVKRKHFDLGRYRDLDLGEAYGHLEEICSAFDAAFAVLKDRQARARYDQELATQRGSNRGNAAMRAEDCYQRGKDLLQRGHQGEALLAFADARKLHDQPLYRAEEALAHFLGHGRTPTAGAEAMLHVQEALAADPKHPAPYVAAGRISLALGAADEAVAHFQEAVKLDPTRGEAFELLEQHWREQAHLEGLEEEYRRTIFLLGSADRRRAAALWKRLARLYRDELKDDRRALLAAKAALKLDPHDSELRLAVARSDGADPRRWSEAVTGLRACLRLDPSDRGALKQLFELHRDAGRHEPARDVAAAAMLRGVADTEQLRFIEQARAPLRSVVRPAFAEAAWAAVVHPDAAPWLTELLGLVARVLRELHPTVPVAAGLPPPIAAQSLWPAAPTQLLTGLARQLEVPEPLLVISPAADETVEPFDGEPPVLVVGPGAASQPESGVAAFRLARALAQFRPGWTAACRREPALLQDYVVAALEVWGPQSGLASAGARREAARVQQLVRAFRARTTVMDEGGRWGARWGAEVASSAGDAVGRWLVGVQRSADRAALLACGDLVAGGRVVAERDAAAETALIDFALSTEYAEARRRLLIEGAAPAAEK
ncbi:MAG: response regulator [Proteobacteria bacterium]|nr:response regulator [Pseudomonadota bacterium]